ncbi:hypothetical protein LCGC14_1587000 [marine sediment metagenome]|uniref:Uncharacterized protein n=1 Tax=marine sediment metagenome TaxID=412755 RepID=A0A0F9J1A2_9ZZZZ
MITQKDLFEQLSLTLSDLYNNLKEYRRLISQLDFSSQSRNILRNMILKLHVLIRRISIRDLEFTN